ncbi:universal stress protein [Streptomyces prunicolor]|uniref:universal stress protein n=1 Tax=Streptomyces prunicolor TaxID=67348 RepID=UPI0038691B65|nr:universal stress protein [Streptomyces prunicolor]
MSGPVVVGVDGSRSSLAVVEVAAQQAERLGVGLELMEVIGWPSGGVRSGVASWDAVRTGALAEAERRALSAAPGVRILREVLVGEPGNLLAAESHRASLTVVGSNGTRGHSTLRDNSLAGCLTARASGPLLVVRGRPDPAGPVLLAVHGTSTLREAAEFAFAEASLRAADLVALHLRHAVATRPYGGSGTAGPEEDEDFALAETLSELRKRYPDVTLRCRRPQGRSRRVLVEASGDSQLLVVGVRGRSRFGGGLLDPVGRTALREADCPVVVVAC